MIKAHIWRVYLLYTNQIILKSQLKQICKHSHPVDKDSLFNSINQ